MTTQYESTTQDWSAYVKFLRHRTGGKGKRILLSLVIGAGLGGIITFLDVPSVIVGILWALVWISALTRVHLKDMQPVAGGIVLGSSAITLTAEGIRTTKPECESLFRWKVVRETHVTGRHIFIMVDNIAGIIVPCRSFSSEIDQEGFLNEIRKHSSS